jgi:hypothetical protein
MNLKPTTESIARQSNEGQVIAQHQSVDRSDGEFQNDTKSMITCLRKHDARMRALEMQNIDLKRRLFETLDARESSDCKLRRLKREKRNPLPPHTRLVLSVKEACTIMKIACSQSVDEDPSDSDDTQLDTPGQGMPIYPIGYDAFTTAEGNVHIMVHGGNGLLLSQIVEQSHKHLPDLTKVYPSKNDKCVMVYGKHRGYHIQICAVDDRDNTAVVKVDRMTVKQMKESNIVSTSDVDASFEDVLWKPGETIAGVPLQHIAPRIEAKDAKE